jgi:hypothetical protein
MAPLLEELREAVRSTVVQKHLNLTTQHVRKYVGK